MKLSLFRKVCLTVMGVGVISSLVTVGTFATFTATTTNTSNTFATGTIQMTNVATGVFTSNVLVPAGFTAPQTISSGDAGSGTDCGTAVVAKACAKVLNATTVVSSGVEPGEFVQGEVTITNSGNLPATVAMQVQNLTTSVPSCGTTAGLGTADTCADVGPQLAVTIEDVTKSYCVFGDKGGSQAPTGSPLLPITTGTCTAINTSAVLGTGSGSASGPPSHEVFGACLSGTCASTTAGTLAAYNYNNGTNSVTTTGSLIYIPGSGGKSLLNTATTGDLTNIAQWTAAGAGGGGSAESHTFKITIGFPDTGFAAGQTLGSDNIVWGNSNAYQNASVSFDLVFYAIQ
jgi:predicted ribosomally synthesized peptide with SipW-like signal peptide